MNTGIQDAANLAWKLAAVEQGANARLLESYDEERGKVALISFNRPDSRNAWNVALVRELMAAVRQANASEAVGAIVLTGEGSVYCAGADIKAPPEPKDENGRRPNPSTLTMGQGDANWLKLLLESKPVIVALNGPAVGLGATLVLLWSGGCLIGGLQFLAAGAFFRLMIQLEENTRATAQLLDEVRARVHAVDAGTESIFIS